MKVVSLDTAMRMISEDRKKKAPQKDYWPDLESRLHNLKDGRSVIISKSELSKVRSFKNTRSAGSCIRKKVQDLLKMKVTVSMCDFGAVIFPRQNSSK